MSVILVTGGGGQVGQALAALRWQEGVTLRLPVRAELDIANPRSVGAWFAANRVDAIVNAAAFTGVDAAEDDAGAAFAANALAPALLADRARAAVIPIVQLSTDYVFDGTAAGAYAEDARVAPLGVYGASKLAGEYAVLAAAPRAVVLRTAWVLSPYRHNFLKTMLRLARDKGALSVVGDQVGCPTSAADIAAAVQAIVLRMMADPQAPRGIFHFVNAGAASWWDLASEIVRVSAAAGGPDAEVRRVSTAAFPTRALRPANSRLATGRIERDYGIASRPWQAAVAEIVARLHEGVPA